MCYISKSLKRTINICNTATSSSSSYFRGRIVDPTGTCFLTIFMYLFISLSDRNFFLSNLGESPGQVRRKTKNCSSSSSSSSASNIPPPPVPAVVKGVAKGGGGVGGVVPIPPSPPMNKSVPSIPPPPPPPVGYVALPAPIPAGDDSPNLDRSDIDNDNFIGCGRGNS